MTSVYDSHHDLKIVILNRVARHTELVSGSNNIFNNFLPNLHTKSVQSKHA